MSIINTKTSRSQRSFVSLLLALAIVASLWFVNPADEFRKVQSQSPCDWLMFGKSPDGSRVVGSGCVRDVQKLEKMWSLDNIQSTPVVWGDRLYCNTYDYVCCFNANTGATIWKYKTDSYYGYPPVFADGRIYFQYYTFRSNNSSILCLDALSGNEIWSYFTETTGQLLKVHNKKLFYNSKDFITCVDAITLKTLWAYKKSYISDFFIANGKVYTKPLVCLDADTGKVVWQTDRKYSSVFSINDGKIYLSTLTDDRKPILNCYNADSGTLLWSMPIDPNAGYPVEAVSIWDNRIFFRVCDYYGKNLNSILCYDLDAKKMLWKVDLGVDIPGALTHLGSNIITCSSSGKLFFISADTGKITRQMDFDGSIAWEIVAAQEKVYINASDTLHCLGIKPQIAKSTGWTMSGGNPQNNRFNPDGTKTRTVKSLWTYETQAPIRSSPAVSNGKVFFGSNDKSVYCVDALNGSKLWSFETGGEVQSTPAIWLGKVLVGSTDGKIYNLSLQTGKKLWEYDAKASIRSSPVVADGMVFFGTDGKMVYCLDVENGEKRWEQRTWNTISSQIAFDKGKVFATYQDSDEKDQHGSFWILHCFDATTGSIVWKLELPEGKDGSPSIADGFIYLATSDRKIWCIDEETGIKVWESEPDASATTSIAVDSARIYYGTYDKRIVCLNRDNGAMCWEFKTDGNLSSSPAVTDGFVCFGESDGKITCLDTVSGQKAWEVTTNGAVTSSPTASEGKVFVGSWDGRLYCISDTPGTLQAPSPCDWSTNGKNNQNNRIVPDGCAPETNKIEKLWECNNVWNGQAILAGRYMFTSVNYRIVKIDALTGAVVWEKGYYWGKNPVTKLVLNAYTQDMLYCTHVDKSKVLCINSLDGSIVWEMAGERQDVYRYIKAENDKIFVQSDNLLCLDASTGKKLWEYDSDQIVLIAEDKVFVSQIIKYSSVLVCLDAKTGQEIWRNENYNRLGSLVYANGKIYGLIFSEEKEPVLRTLYCVNPGTGEKVWESSVPSKSLSAPIVVDGKIYLGADLFIYVLDEATGNQIDKFDYTVPEDRYGAGILTYSGGKLYWRSMRGYLYCKDAKTGKMVFSVQDQSLRSNNTQNNSIVMIALGKIYITDYSKITCWGDSNTSQVCDWPMPGKSYQGNANASEICPDAKTVLPKKVWEFDSNTGYKTSDKGNTIPITANGCLYFYTNNGKFWSVDEQTGKSNWSIDLDKEEGCYNPAVYGDGKVFFTTFDQNQTMFGKLYCLDATNGIKLWDFSDDGKIWSSPVFWENKVFIGSTNNKEYCLDADSGIVIWECECKRNVNSTPAIVDGRIYFGSDDNKFQCLDATTGKVIWTFATGAECNGSVSVSDGKVYFSTNDYWLYCLDTQTGSYLWKYFASPPMHEAPTVISNRTYMTIRGSLICYDTNTLKELWKVTTRGTYNSPTVIRDRVYLGDDDGSLTCFNAYTGETTWGLEGFLCIRSSVIWKEGKLFFGTLDGKVFCYEEYK